MADTPARSESGSAQAPIEAPLVTRAIELTQAAEQSVRTTMDVAALVAAHHAAVYRYAFRLAGSVAEAEDLTQQTFLIAHEKLSQVRDTACAQSWLLSVVRSCFLKSVRRTRPIAAEDAALDVNAVPGPAGRDRLEREEECEVVQQALAELPEEFRLVLLMFYFEELSYRQIAKQLQVPVGTVMSRLARAKNQLRQRLMPVEEPAGREGRHVAPVVGFAGVSSAKLSAMDAT